MYPASRHSRIASRVSVTVPIWLTLISAEFAIFALDGVGDDGRVGAEVVVADEFHLVPQAGGDRDPPVLVALGEPVLDRSTRGTRAMIASSRSIMSRAGQRLTSDVVGAVGLAELADAARSIAIADAVRAGPCTRRR